MVAQYTIFGRQVGSHVLSMATLGTTFGLIALAMGGKEKAAKEQGPSINAGSKDEEAFIQEFLKNNGGEQKAKQ